ncbi:hypothetical protein FRACYDRAFT_269761, partial [Fragilariopsis cylindrus CCMP1102]
MDKGWELIRSEVNATIDSTNKKNEHDAIENQNVDNCDDDGDDDDDDSNDGDLNRKPKEYHKTKDGNFTARIGHKDKTRTIGTFRYERDSALAYKMSRRKKNQQPSSNSKHGESDSCDESNDEEEPIVEVLDDDEDDDEVCVIAESLDDDDDMIEITPNAPTLQKKRKRDHWRCFYTDDVVRNINDATAKDVTVSIAMAIAAAAATTETAANAVHAATSSTKNEIGKKGK